jgi:osmoprotectant transport system permease protein
MSAMMVLEHLNFVIVALALTIIIGIPLGIAAYLLPAARKLILKSTELLQTMPALALLGIIMVFLGAGKATVITGLFLYSLLPVVQNTCVGFSAVNPSIKEAAMGMGMTRLYCLVRVEFPAAFPLIFAGVRISAVTSVGTAVFAVFVGGGGLGSVIYRGIRISNMALILQGMLALLIMASLCDGLMALAENRLRRRYNPNRDQNNTNKRRKS